MDTRVPRQVAKAGQLGQRQEEQVTQAKIFGLIVAVTAALLLSDNAVKSRGGVCTGKLVKHEDGSLTIKVDRENVCEVDPSGTQKILSVCAVGHDCEVEGEVHGCEDSGECVAIKNITSVTDLTLHPR
jgi:hypothetical protein